MSLGRDILKPMQMISWLFLLEKQFSEIVYKPFADREPLEYKIDSLILSDFVMSSKRIFKKQSIKNTFCFGEPIALPACGFHMGVQTQSIRGSICAYYAAQHLLWSRGES